MSEPISVVNKNKADGSIDEVVQRVGEFCTFHFESMGDASAWMACYVNDVGGKFRRVAFNLTVLDGKLVVNIQDDDRPQLTEGNG